MLRELRIFPLRLLASRLPHGTLKLCKSEELPMLRVYASHSQERTLGQSGHSEAGSVPGGKPTLASDFAYWISRLISDIQLNDD